VDERVWRLPGPRSFVRDIVAEYARGRHVVTVLPEVLASDAVFTDGLGVTVLEDFARQSVSARRVYDAGEDTPILDTVSQALIFDDPPATVSALLRHPEVENTVAVLVARELGARARSGLSAFLARVEVESHATRNYAQRLSFVAIVDRGQLPGFRGGASSDAGTTSIWWWARVARWDVAAHIADLAERVALPGVLADVRTESIVEVARWELDLAEHLVLTWEGEPRDLPSLLKDWRSVCAPAMNGSRRTDADGLRPPHPVLPAWDQRLVEGWHDELSVTTCSLAAEPEKLGRLVWAAQARVLLPWIDERRSTLQPRVTEVLGEPVRPSRRPPSSPHSCVWSPQREIAAYARPAGDGGQDLPVLRLDHRDPAPCLMPGEKLTSEPGKRLERQHRTRLSKSFPERGYRVGVVGKLVRLVSGFGWARIRFDGRRVRNDVDAQDQLVARVFPRSKNRLGRGIR
jgi:hypothetical protein